MRFDWTVNIGNLIPIITFLFIIVYRIGKIETKVDAMWNVFVKNKQ